MIAGAPDPAGPPCITVYVTAADAAAAESLGRALVQERLAACANVLPGIVSVYEWQGALQRESESALLLKTRAELFERVAARVKALHAYEVPCIVAWPLVAASEAYLAWVVAQTEGA